MKYFEKAVENYAKEKKARMNENILLFNRLIEQMTADGRCPGLLECRFCPLRLANESEENLDVKCYKIKPEAVRHIIAMEVSE